MHDHSVALITGANKGIGLAIAQQFAAHGLTVLVGSRDLRVVKPRPQALKAMRTPCSST